MNLRNPIAHCSRITAFALSLLCASALSAEAQTVASDNQEAKTAPALSGVLNINTALEDELMKLPGIGPSRAQAIIELRGKLNGFKKVEDLMRVKGIGRKTFRKLEPMLRVDGKSTLTAG